LLPYWKAALYKFLGLFQICNLEAKSIGFLIHFQIRNHISLWFGIENPEQHSTKKGCFPIGKQPFVNKLKSFTSSDTY